MKIAVFYSGYLPGEKYGGPVTSLYNFTELLGKDCSIYIICSDHDLKDNKRYENIQTGWNDVGKAKVLYLADAEFTKEKYREILNELKPDLIYGSSIFSASHNLPLYSLSNELGIPFLLAPRGELNDSALALKKLKKSIYLFYLMITGKLRNVMFQATSVEEHKDICRNLKLPEGRVFVLPNIPTVHVKKENIEKSVGCLRACFVGRIVPNKNLLFALQAVCGISEKIEFDIYGPREDKDYWDKCQAIINSAPPNVHISYIGALPPMKMKNEYSNYDCLLSPTLFENYGQAIVEAMLHDTPVVISKGTTPWDEINDYGAGYAISLDSIDEYKEAVKSIAMMDNSRYKDLVSRLNAFCNKEFDTESLKNNYLDAFKKMMR